MMNIIQLSLIFFGLFMMYVVRIHYRKGQISFNESMVWVGMWGMFILIDIMPGSFKGLAQTLQVARVFDLLVIIAFMILTVLTFLNRFNQKKIENKIEKFFRKQALKKE
jgi:hypothetical protein